MLRINTEEIHNAEQRLKDAGKYPAKTTKILEEKIKKEFNKMFSILTEEMKNIKNDIIKLSNKAIETHYQQNDFSPSKIRVIEQKSFDIGKYFKLENYEFLQQVFD